MLLNIVSCCGFVQEDTPTVFFTSRSKLVSYYLPKGFLMLAHKSQAINNIPTRVKQRIHAVEMHENYSVMTCNT